MTGTRQPHRRSLWLRAAGAHPTSTTGIQADIVLAYRCLVIYIPWLGRSEAVTRVPDCVICRKATLSAYFRTTQTVHTPTLPQKSTISTSDTTSLALSLPPIYPVSSATHCKALQTLHYQLSRMLSTATVTTAPRQAVIGPRLARRSTGARILRSVLSPPIFIRKLQLKPCPSSCGLWPPNHSHLYAPPTQSAACHCGGVSAPRAGQ